MRLNHTPIANARVPRGRNPSKRPSPPAPPPADDEETDDGEGAEGDAGDPDSQLRRQRLIGEEHPAGADGERAPDLATNVRRRAPRAGTDEEMNHRLKRQAVRRHRHLSGGMGERPADRHRFVEGWPERSLRVVQSALARIIHKPKGS